MTENRKGVFGRMGGGKTRRLTHAENSEEDGECFMCGTQEETKVRAVAHRTKVVCSYCWKEYSLSEIASEADKEYGT